MLNIIKTALRIKTSAYDETEIIPLIEACKADLEISGIKKIKATDPLIVRAVVLYCKANFGNNPDAEKFEKAYNALKISLCLAGDYNE